MQKVGLIVGREWSFPPALIEEVARRDAGVQVEYVQLGGTSMDEPIPYAVIVDRISHEVPYYRTYLKHAVLQGVTVVNNPFMWTSDDKLFDASLATRLGVPSPKTIAREISAIRSIGTRSPRTWACRAFSRTRTEAGGRRCTSVTRSTS